MEDEDPVQWVRPYEQAVTAASPSIGPRAAAFGRSASSGLSALFSPRVQAVEELQPASESRRFRHGFG